MASSKGLLGSWRWKSMPNLIPRMSELRIVLLGEDIPLTNRVGNFILGRAAFQTDTLVCSVKLHSERANVQVEGRNITIINTSHLYNPQLSQEELNQRVKECITLADPGPHVFLLVLQSGKLKHERHDRVRNTLETYSPLSKERSIVITTGEDHGVISECEMRQHRVQDMAIFDKHQVLQLLKKIEEVVKVTGGSDLQGWKHSVTLRRHLHHLPDITAKTDEDAIKEKQEENKKKEEHVPTKIPGTSSYRFTNNVKGRVKEIEKYGKEQHIVNSQSIAFPHHSVYGGIWRKDSGDICKMCVAKKSKPTPHLNLVLLGMEEVKASISKIVLGEKPSVVQTESSSMCVNQGQVCGHLITLVEMPTLYNTQLSEEEVMHLTQCCVSVCNTGVHAFLIAVPDGPLTNDDKAELDTFQNIFSSRVNDHTIFIINQKSQRQQLDKMLQSVINARGARYTLYRSSTDAKKLLTPVKSLLEKNNNRQYTMAMYFDAQIETQLQYKRENKNLQQQITELKMSKRNETQDLFKNPDTLRIVLLGKTGVGKSATGNTILGRNQFKHMLSAQSVTSMCQKVTEEINGRQISVVDTPGLFDTNIDNDEIKQEIVKCISMAAPGPHVFLLVLSIGQRFTKEERDAVKITQKCFGKTSNMYTIVLFTRGDGLSDMSIEQYIEDAGPNLNKLLQDCGNRYHVFNNQKPSHIQVLTLLHKIDSMVKENGGSCYTNEMFQEVEDALEKEKERILKEREEQIEREKEELKKKHEAEMKEMKRQMEKHKERQETEKRQKEKEFKEREEQIKKEMAKQEKQLREDFRKRKEEDDFKMKEWLQEINREREENRNQWERQREQDQKRRDKEEEERRKKEQEWKEKQGEEKEKFKREKEEIKKNKEEELKKLQNEFEQKTVEEEKRRRDLEEKIKDAEESKKKELQDLQLSQQREWERRMREEEKKKKEQEKNWEERMTDVDEKWSREQIRKQEQYDRERQKEKEERELKENKRKEKEEREKKRIENDFNEKIRRMEEQVKVQRDKDERERMKKDEEHRKEMEEKLHKQHEEFRKEKEEEERKHDEEKERNLAFIREQHNKEKEKLKRETEEAARKQAEEEFTAELGEKVKEAKEAGFKEGCEKVESERTILSKFIDSYWK